MSHDARGSRSATYTERCSCAVQNRIRRRTETSRWSHTYTNLNASLVFLIPVRDATTLTVERPPLSRLVTAQPTHRCLESIVVA
jgi:hypothetical protein